jgi:hypothetical protein
MAIQIKLCRQLNEYFATSMDILDGNTQVAVCNECGESYRELVKRSETTDSLPSSFNFKRARVEMLSRRSKLTWKDVRQSARG